MRVRPAIPVDMVARREALRGLKVVHDAVLAGTNGSGEPACKTTFETALRNALNAVIPLRVALQVCGEAAVTEVLGAAAMTDLRSAEAQASRADAAAADMPIRSAIPLLERFPDANEYVVDAYGRVRLPIPLLERFSDANESMAHAGDADARARPALETPTSFPDAFESEVDGRLFDEAAVAIGATFTEEERRIAANMMNQVRMHMGRATERAARLRPSLGSSGRLRRARAPRAPRHRSHRSAVSPSRDGPPPSDEPAPVASPSPRGAVGGAR